MLRSFNYIRPFNLKRIRQYFKLGHIVAIRPGYYQGQRDSRSVNHKMTFASVFSPVSGVFPYRFPCQGRFTHTTIRTKPRPVDTAGFFIVFKTRNPQRPEKSLFTPKPEMPVYGAYRSIRCGQRLPLDSGTRNIEHSLKNSAGGS
jgi:hypothetical protein